MDDFINETISENTTPPFDSGGESQEDNTEGEASGGGNEEGGNANDSNDTEIVGDSPSNSQSGSISETVGGNDSPAFSGAPLPDEFRQALDGLNSVAERLDNGTPDLEGLMDSVRSLVDVITSQSEQHVVTYSAIIPISGYRDYDYPITVTWRVSPSAPNAPSSIESSETFYTPEEFEARYQAMCDMVGGSLKSFRIQRISDCSDLDFVYDADNLPEEPELPEDDESEDLAAFREEVLASISELHEDLQTVIDNDAYYWEQYAAMHDQYLEIQLQYTEMQEHNIELQYHMLASNIAIGFVLLLTLGYTIAHGFLQRMKVG